MSGFVLGAPVESVPAAAIGLAGLALVILIGAIAAPFVDRKQSHAFARAASRDPEAVAALLAEAAGRVLAIKARMLFTKDPGASISPEDDSSFIAERVAAEDDVMLSFLEFPPPTLLDASFGEEVGGSIRTDEERPEMWERCCHGCTSLEFMGREVTGSHMVEVLHRDQDGLGANFSPRSRPKRTPKSQRDKAVPCSVICFRICCHTDVLNAIWAFEPFAPRLARIAALASALLVGFLVATIITMLAPTTSMGVTVPVVVIVFLIAAQLFLRLARRCAAPNVVPVGGGLVAAIARRRRLEGSRQFLEDAKEYLATIASEREALDEIENGDESDEEDGMGGMGAGISAPPPLPRGGQSDASQARMLGTSSTTASEAPDPRVLAALEEEDVSDAEVKQMVEKTSGMRKPSWRVDGSYPIRDKDGRYQSPETRGPASRHFKETREGGDMGQRRSPKARKDNFDDDDDDGMTDRDGDFVPDQYHDEVDHIVSDSSSYDELDHPSGPGYRPVEVPPIYDDSTDEDDYDTDDTDGDAAALRKKMFPAAQRDSSTLEDDGAGIAIVIDETESTLHAAHRGKRTGRKLGNRRRRRAMPIRRRRGTQVDAKGKLGSGRRKSGLQVNTKLEGGSHSDASTPSPGSIVKDTRRRARRLRGSHPAASESAKRLDAKRPSGLFELAMLHTPRHDSDDDHSPASTAETDTPRDDDEGDDSPHALRSPQTPPSAPRVPGEDYDSVVGRTVGGGVEILEPSVIGGDRGAAIGVPDGPIGPSMSAFGDSESVVTAPKESGPPPPQPRPVLVPRPRVERRRKPDPPHTGARTLASPPPVASSSSGSRRHGREKKTMDSRKPQNLRIDTDPTVEDGASGQSAVANLLGKTDAFLLDKAYHPERLMITRLPTSTVGDAPSTMLQDNPAEEEVEEKHEMELALDAWSLFRSAQVRELVKARKVFARRGHGAKGGIDPTRPLEILLAAGFGSPPPPAPPTAVSNIAVTIWAAFGVLLFFVGAILLVLMRDPLAETAAQYGLLSAGIAFIVLQPCGEYCRIRCTACCRCCRGPAGGASRRLYRGTRLRASAFASGWLAPDAGVVVLGKYSFVSPPRYAPAADPASLAWGILHEEWGVLAKAGRMLTDISPDFSAEIEAMFANAVEDEHENEIFGALGMQVVFGFLRDIAIDPQPESIRRWGEALGLDPFALIDVVLSSYNSS